MKNKLFKPLLLSLFASASLVSCGGDNLTDEERLDSYSIVKGQTLSEQRVYQTGPAFSTTAFVSIDLNAHKWHWNYDMNPLFFDSLCTFTKDELEAFANVYHYETNFENEMYSCLGTNFYCYSERLSDDPSAYTVKMPDEAGIYAPYLVCDLIEYIITPKDDSASFKIYGATDSPYLALLKAYQ